MRFIVNANSHIADSFFDEIEKIASKKKKVRQPTQEELQQKSNRGLLGAGAMLGTNALLGSLTTPFIKDKQVELPPGPEKAPMPEPYLPREPGESHFSKRTRNPEFDKYFEQSLRGHANEHGDRGNLRQIARADKIREQMGGIGREELAYNMRSGMGPAVAVGGEKYQVHIPDNAKESIIGHELGHIKNDKMWGKVGRGVNSFSRLGASVGALPAAFAAGYSDDPSWTPGLIQAGVSAPMLVDEALASGRAVKHMVKQHGLAKGLSKSKVLLPAFGTYAALGATPLAITGVRKYLKKKKEDK